MKGWWERSPEIPWSKYEVGELRKDATALLEALEGLLRPHESQSTLLYARDAARAAIRRVTVGGGRINE